MIFDNPFSTILQVKITHLILAAISFILLTFSSAINNQSNYFMEMFRFVFLLGLLNGIGYFWHFRSDENDLFTRIEHVLNNPFSSEKLRKLIMLLESFFLLAFILFLGISLIDALITENSTNGFLLILESFGFAITASVSFLLIREKIILDWVKSQN